MKPSEKKFIQSNTYESILKQASERRKSIFNLSKSYPAFITLIILICLSFLIWKTVDNSMKSNDRIAYEKAVSSIITRFNSNYQSHLQVLNSMRGFYDILVEVVRDYYILYGTAPVKTYSSIRSIMYVAQVKKAEIPNFVYNVQCQGSYDYGIHPKSDREIIYPAQIIVPDSINHQMFGFDFSSDPVFLHNINISIEEGRVVSTPVLHIRGKDKTDIYLIDPIYKRGFPKTTLEQRRNNFEGMVVLEINLPLLLHNALGKGIPSDTSVIFQCFFNDNNSQPLEVYKSNNSNLLATGFKPYLTSEQKINIADKELTIKFATIPNFGGSFQKILPLIAFLASLALSFVIFGFLLSVITSRSRAVDLAERMTRSQRRIVDSSNDIIAVCDLNGVWKSMNPASLQIFGYQPQELIGEKLDLLFETEIGKHEFYSIINTQQEDFQKRIDTQVITKNKEYRWINWDVTLSLTDKLLYCIGRDVTLEKLAEEQEKLKNKQVQLARQISSEASESKSYFMTKLSHQLRNSLTSIIGYQQLLTNKYYDSESEHDSYLKIVNDSSEELFVFVSDMIEIATQNQQQAYKDLSVIPLESFKDDIEMLVRDRISNISEITGEILNMGKNSTFLAVKDLLENAVILGIQALSEHVEKIDITMNIQDNPYEGATEIQILSGANPVVAELIEIYKKNSNNLIDSLKFDKNDVLLHLGIASSMFRMMNGNMSVETFGPEDGNLIQITMPTNKQQI